MGPDAVPSQCSHPIPFLLASRSCWRMGRGCGCYIPLAQLLCLHGLGFLLSDCRKELYRMLFTCG
jgi:hypothetical protein